VSVTTGTIAYVTAGFLWSRKATPRDRWNAIFLFVFSSMQWVDAALWYLHDVKGQPLGYPCSPKAQAVTIIGLGIIISEPIACLIGSMYARKKWCTKMELFLYVFCNLTIEFLMGYVVTGSICTAHGPCPFLTESKHLLLAHGVDSNGGPMCWREYGFWGIPSHEIPLWLRFAFLAGMVYPYVTYMKPVGSGIIQATALVIAWLIGYMSDSHASVWCLANVAQVVTMIADPYWFPPTPEAGSTPVVRSGNIVRDIYSKRKVAKSFDVIVVGSGIGGLSCAALLSRAGLRVLVLEQHYRAGGCTHEFQLKGDEFDSGIHYVGGSSMIRSLLSFITDCPGVDLVQMGSASDGYLYDEFDLGIPDGQKDSLIVRFRAGQDAVRKELVSLFPNEKDGIERYFHRIEEAQESLTAMALLKALPDWILGIGFVRRFLVQTMQRSARETASEVIEQCVKDSKLRALLSAGQLIDWNLQPDKCSWAVVGAMASYYQPGGFYPSGGSRVVAERIIPIIERAGGRVLVRAPVKEFIVDNEGGPTEGRVTGVRLANGDELFARKAVVSDMGAFNTFKALPSDTLEKHGLKQTVPGPGPGNGHMTAFINLDGPPEAFGLTSSNIHSWLDLPKFNYNPSKMQEAFYEDPIKHADGCLMTLTCPCLKDPEYRRDHPDSSNVLLLTEAKWEWFKDMDLEEVKAHYAGEKTSGGNHGNRPKDYLDFKKKWEKVFLDRLYKYFPKTKGHVSGVEIGTPITLAHFLGASHGGSYGMAWTPERFDETLLDDYMRVESKISGLYLAGESALFGGFVGAMSGGYIAALKCLGLWKFLKVLLCTESVDARSEHKARLYNVRDPAPSPSALLTLFIGFIGLMISGRRVGKAIA